MIWFKKIMRWVSFFFIIFFAWRYQEDLWTALTQVKSLGFWFIALPALFLIWNVAATEGWWLFVQVFRIEALKSWLHLYWIRIHAQSINFLVPFGVGGDIYRTVSLSEKSRSKSVAAMLSDRYSDFIAESILIVFGLLMGWSIMKGFSNFWEFWLLLPMIYVALTFLAVKSWFFLGKRLPKVKNFLRRQEIYHGTYSLNRALIRSIHSHFAERIVMVLELVLVAHLLHLSIPLSGILFASALASVFGMLLFFMPGRFGSLEGGFPLAFQMMQIDPTLGLSLAMARRARQLFVALIGLFLLQIHSWHWRWGESNA